MSAVGETALSFGYSKIGYRLKQNGLSVMTVTLDGCQRIKLFWDEEQNHHAHHYRRTLSGLMSMVRCSCYDQSVTLR